jgi:hypothetical protein
LPGFGGSTVTAVLNGRAYQHFIFHLPKARRSTPHLANAEKACAGCGRKFAFGRADATVVLKQDPDLQGIGAKWIPVSGCRLQFRSRLAGVARQRDAHHGAGAQFRAQLH